MIVLVIPKKELKNLSNEECWLLYRTYKKVKVIVDKIFTYLYITDCEYCFIKQYIVQVISLWYCEITEFYCNIEINSIT